MKNRTLTGHVAAIVTIFIWGTTFISTKVLLRSFLPLEILLFRFVIGFAALTLAYPRRMGRLHWKRELMMAAAGLCGVTLYFLMENIALTYTLASNVGVIVSISPFFTALLCRFFLDGERPGRSFYIGFVAAIAGIFLISFSGSSALELNPVGDILAVLSAAVWAVYSILTRKISSYGYHTIQATRRIFFYGILLMLPTLAFLPFHPDFSQLAAPVNLLNVLYLGLCASALCFVSWNFALKALGAVRTSIYIYLVPVVTVVTSVIVLHETITWMAVVGAALTLSGLFLSERKSFASGAARQEGSETDRSL